jgi:predicted HTH transcriptional regulator
MYLLKDMITKATKKELLEFIKSLGYIQPWQIRQKFGYTELGANHKIMELKKQGLINNPVTGKWNLTYTGLRRLEYYNAKDNKNKGAGN